MKLWEQYCMVDRATKWSISSFNPRIWGQRTSAREFRVGLKPSSSPTILTSKDFQWYVKVCSVYKGVGSRIAFSISSLFGCHISWEVNEDGHFALQRHFRKPALWFLISQMLWMLKESHPFLFIIFFYFSF